MKHLRLTGTPYERGQTHGSELQAEIHGMVQRWDEDLRANVGLPLEAYVARYLADTNYVDASREFAPDIMREVEGIADGAGISFEVAFAIQASLDEHWHHREVLTGEMPLVTDRCSGFGVVQAGQPTILAQNQDLPTYLDGAQVVLEVIDTDHDVRVLMPSIAGFIGLHGMNDRGVGNCVNTLAQLSSDDDGPLSTFVIRAMLNCHTFDDAVDLVRTAKHTVGLNYIVADATRVIDLETSTNRVAEFRPHPQRVYHTNHPLENSDWAADHNHDASDATDEFNTHERFHILRRELDHDDLINVERAQTLLSGEDGHVCRNQNNPVPAFTFTSAVMELGPEPVMHVSPGPPTQVGYEMFRFS